jgi:hypothetical protein
MVTSLFLVLRAAYAARTWAEHTQQFFVCLVSFVLFFRVYPTPDPRIPILLANMDLERKALL